MVAGDLDNDGVTDLVTASNTGNTVSVLMGREGWTYDVPVPYAVGSGPVAMALADFDGDLALDLAVANSGDATISRSAAVYARPAAAPGSDCWGVVERGTNLTDAGAESPVAGLK